MNIIRETTWSQSGKFPSALFQQHRASQIRGTFTAQLRHRDAAIPRLLFGGGL